MEFPRILKELRESYEMTQVELANALGVSRSTITGYETRDKQPDYDKLLMISKLFDVSTDYLLTGNSTELLTPAKSASTSEKILDHKVITAYRNLGFEEKQDVLKYVQLLELKHQQK